MATTDTTTFSAAVRDVYSKEILFAASPSLRFDQFSVVEEQLGTDAGLTIKILKASKIAKGGKLTEGTPMTTKAMGGSFISLTVTEYGNAVEVSEKLLQSSFIKQMEIAARLLGDDYAETIDGEERDAVLTSANRVYAGQRANRGALTSSDKFGVTAIKDSVETLAVKKARRVGDSWISFIHPHVARQMRDDSAWINAAQYAGSTQIFQGEIGRIEDTRFLETTMMPYIEKITGNIFVDGADSGADNNAPHGSLDVYLSAVFGAEAFAKAVGLPVELRDNGITDFGRVHALAWYAIMGFGLIDQNRIVIVESV